MSVFNPFTHLHAFSSDCVKNKQTLEFWVHGPHNCIVIHFLNYDLHSWNEVWFLRWNIESLSKSALKIDLLNAFAFCYFSERQGSCLSILDCWLFIYTVSSWKYITPSHSTERKKVKIFILFLLKVQGKHLLSSFLAKQSWPICKNDFIGNVKLFLCMTRSCVTKMSQISFFCLMYSYRSWWSELKVSSLQSVGKGFDPVFISSI